jgi:hypothetical protein
VVGTSGTASGRLELWQNLTSSNLISLTRISLSNVSYVPYSIVAADFGSAAATDVAVGYRRRVSYGGGVRIFYRMATPRVGLRQSGGVVVNHIARDDREQRNGLKRQSPRHRSSGPRRRHQGSNTTGALVVLNPVTTRVWPNPRGGTAASRS